MLERLSGFTPVWNLNGHICLTFTLWVPIVYIECVGVKAEQKNVKLSSRIWLTPEQTINSKTCYREVSSLLTSTLCIVTPLEIQCGAGLLLVSQLSYVKYHQLNMYSKFGSGQSSSFVPAIFG